MLLLGDSFIGLIYYTLCILKGDIPVVDIVKSPSHLNLSFVENRSTFTKRNAFEILRSDTLHLCGCSHAGGSKRPTNPAHLKEIEKI